MKIDPYKRELLYRKAQGKKIMDAFEQKISQLFPKKCMECVLLDLTETDKIIENIKALRTFHSQNSDFTSFNDCIEFIEPEIYNREYYALIDDDWKYCGALKVGIGILPNAKYNFNENTSDEIRLIAADFTTQVCIDYTDDFDCELFECSIKKHTPL